MKKIILILTILLALISCDATGPYAPQEDPFSTILTEQVATGNYWIISNSYMVYYTTNVAFVSNGAYVDYFLYTNLYTNMFLHNPFTSNYIN